MKVLQGDKERVYWEERWDLVNSTSTYEKELYSRKRAFDLTTGVGEDDDGDSQPSPTSVCQLFDPEAGEEQRRKYFDSLGGGGDDDSEYESEDD